VAALAPPYLYLEPPVPPPLRPYGLFDVAAGPIPFPVDAAAAGGVMYQPNDCEDDVFMRMVNCPPITGTVAFSGIETAISGAPFSVYTSWQCSTIGYSFEEQAARVRTRLGLRAQTAVERRLWQGQTSATDGNFSGLFANAIPLPAAACVTEAVEMLEQTLADNGVFGGIIHARVGMAAHIGQAHLLETQGRMKTTPYGTPYVFGQGYSGIGPTGQATDGTTEWMYASGRVLVWKTPEMWVPPVSQVVDKTTNTVFLVAQEIYAVTVECGVWAIPVTRTCGTTGAT
jgi:hypothetical protein